MINVKLKVMLVFCNHVPDISHKLNEIMDTTNEIFDGIVNVDIKLFPILVYLPSPGEMIYKRICLEPDNTKMTCLSLSRYCTSILRKYAKEIIKKYNVDTCIFVVDDVTSFYDFKKKIYVDVVYRPMPEVSGIIFRGCLAHGHLELIPIAIACYLGLKPECHNKCLMNPELREKILCSECRRKLKELVENRGRNFM